MTDVIVRERVASQVHRYLRTKILTGEVAAGSRLIETEIASELNVSRTPVREALVLLQGEGLARPLDSGGIAVCDLRRELIDVLDVRIALETHAVRKAARNITAEELERLAQVCDRMEALPADDVKGRAALNRRFHEALIGVAHNRRLVDIVNEYQDYFAAAQPLFTPAAVQRTQREHRAIVDALARHDTEAAVRAVADHIAGAGELILGATAALAAPAGSTGTPPPTKTHS